MRKREISGSACRGLHYTSRKKTKYIVIISRVITLVKTRHVI
jgi:hypothetical protein